MNARGFSLLLFFGLACPIFAQSVTTHVDSRRTVFEDKTTHRTIQVHLKEAQVFLMSAQHSLRLDLNVEVMAEDAQPTSERLVRSTGLQTVPCHLLVLLKQKGQLWSHHSFLLRPTLTAMIESHDHSFSIDLRLPSAINPHDLIVDLHWFDQDCLQPL